MVKDQEKKEDGQKARRAARMVQQAELARARCDSGSKGRKRKKLAVVDGREYTDEELYAQAYVAWIEAEA